MKPLQRFKDCELQVASGTRATARVKSFPTPSGRGRERSERVRGGQPQRQAAPALPQEKIQQSVRQEQLEYHRHQQQADEHRSEAAPASERAKEKAVPALFGVVGRKVA